VALNWVIAKGALPIPGAKNADQARENAGALGWRMSSDEMRHLELVADSVIRR
jgi:diketogulonate reductase-like aldo/keto reductase